MKLFVLDEGAKDSLVKEKVSKSIEIALLNNKVNQP
jgi:hypothetical protein